MALIKCKECGKEISDTAKKCPNCGVTLKSNTRIIIVVVTILFLIVGIGLYCYNKNKKEKEYRETIEQIRQTEDNIKELERIKREYEEVYYMEDSYYRTRKLQELQKDLDKITK